MLFKHSERGLKERSRQLCERRVLQLDHAKNLGAYGDGGGDDDRQQLSRQIKLLWNYGQSKKYITTFLGSIGVRQITNCNAARHAIATGRMERKEETISQVMEALAQTEVMLPSERTYAMHVYQLLVIRLAGMDNCQRFLQTSGIQSQIHYPIPAHRKNAYVAFTRKDFSACRRFAAKFFLFSFITR